MTIRKQVFIAAILVLGGIGWATYHFVTGPEWQEFSAAALWASLAQANFLYLLLGCAFTFSSYLFRAFRWRAFLRPVKESRLGNLFVATLVGFAAIVLLSRAGEIVRPWMIAQKERLPLSSQLAAWTLERVFDTLSIVGLLGAALWLFPAVTAEGARAAAMMARFRAAGAILTLIAFGLAAILAFIRYAPRFTEAVLMALAKPLPVRIQNGVRIAFEHFSATLAVIQSVRRFLECVFWSALVWVMVVATYWSVAHAFGAPLAELSLGALTLIMLASVTGSVAQLPGVGGGPQLAIALTLTELFGIALAPATAMAITTWGITFLLVVLPGLPLAAREGLSWSRVRALLQSQPQSEPEL
jgi:glycosyltransferase 2 family protein